MLLTQCILAEALYNAIVKAYIELDYSDASTDAINDLRSKYNECLEYLYTHGIGGVMINGNFRYTYNFNPNNN